MSVPMKPRFSILTLLGVTAYVAMNAAAHAQPLTYLPYGAYYLAVAMLVHLIVIAAGPTTERSVFARGLLLAVALTNAIQFWEPEELLLYGRGASTFTYTPDTVQSKDTRQALVSQNTHLVFGIVCGSLALWRYRRLERRAKETQ